MDSEGLTWVDSLVLGVIQGITEFIPISSDGHLVVARHLLNYHKDLLVFDVLLHVGTLGALLLVFRKESLALLVETWKIGFESLKQKSLRPILAADSQTRWTMYIWITTFVTGVLGLAFEKKVTETFASIHAAGIGFLITSVFLFCGSYKRFGERQPFSFPIWYPVVIAIGQSMALLPGVSRSGMTIALALIFGTQRLEAGRFSFVAAIPIIFLASLYEARHLLGHPLENAGMMLVGVFVSFLVGVWAIKILMAMLSKLSLYPFAIYTAVLGALVLIFSR